MRLPRLHKCVVLQPHMGCFHTHLTRVVLIPRPRLLAFFLKRKQEPMRSEGGGVPKDTPARCYPCGVSRSNLANYCYFQQQQATHNDPKLLAAVAAVIIAVTVVVVVVVVVVIAVVVAIAMVAVAAAAATASAAAAAAAAAVVVVLGAVSCSAFGSAMLLPRELVPHPALQAL